MPGRVPMPMDSSDGPEVDTVNYHFEDFEDEDPQDKEIDYNYTSPPYDLHIPPRTNGKRRKSKGRRRNSETIWTIVSEKENLYNLQQNHSSSESASTSSTSKSKSAKKDQSIISTKETKLSKKYEKNSKASKKANISVSGTEGRCPSFFDNPILESGLQNWTLPRVELWCKDPSCGINVHLWDEYCQSQQSQLSQLPVNLPQHHHFHQIMTGHRKQGVCPSCNGLVPPPMSTNHDLVPLDPLSLTAPGIGGPVDGLGPPNHQQTLHHNLINGSSSNNKSDNAFWNFTKFEHPLQRDHSFHSVGGFTLNGQYNTQVKKRCIVKFCSSHKIALVVSTFSLMVTVGLIITLILMKKRGMMDTMDMMPT